MKAPFPYFGGKSQIAAHVWAALGDVDHYMEPFFGSGAVLLSRPGYDPARHTETVCDKDGYVCNAWRGIQFAPEEVDNAMTNRSFLDAIRRLNTASPTDLAQFTQVLSEWDIIEAVNTAHLVKGRVEIIRKFGQMIGNKVPEKPDMQDYLRDHPWLIDPKWTMLVHEQSLDQLLVDKFKLAKSGTKDGSRRLDFFCLGDRYKTAHVVETKRPDALVGRKEFDQLRDYVLFLRQKLSDEVTDEEHKRNTIRGLLITDRIRSGDEGHAKTHQESGVFDIRSWGNLLLAAETMHKEFLDIVKMRAPADDPRMKGLSSDDSATGTTLPCGRKRKGDRKGKHQRKGRITK